MDQSTDNESTDSGSRGHPGRSDVGKRVSFYSESDKKTKYGVLRYYGEPEFAPGYWCGVELDQPEGKNNGSLQGIRYFSCDDGFGVFIPLSKVELDAGSKPTSKQPARTDWQKKVGRLLPGVAGHRKAPAVAASGMPTSASGGRKPLKAFSLQDKQHGFAPTPLGSKTRTIVPKSASSDNLKAMSKKQPSQPAKKTSSERDLRNAKTPDFPGYGTKPATKTVRSVRSSSFSGVPSREPSTSRAPSRSSVVSGPAFTDPYSLSPSSDQSRAISPASSRGTSVSQFSIGGVVTLRDIAAQNRAPTSYTLHVRSDKSPSSGGEEGGTSHHHQQAGLPAVVTSDETSHMGGSYLYFSWDGSAANDRVKPHDTLDALVHRLMDRTQSVRSTLHAWMILNIKILVCQYVIMLRQTEGLTVYEVVEALRHHMAICQHNTG